MAKRIKAKLPWHVVATGYSGDDFKAIGRGDVFLQEDFTEDDVSWHPTFDAAMEHPAAREGYGGIQRNKAKREIDGKYDVVKSRNHSAKARESELVLFEGVTDPLRLPFLIADVAARSDGKTLVEAAQECWDMHIKEAVPESERVEERRLV